MEEVHSEFGHNIYNQTQEQGSQLKHSIFNEELIQTNEELSSDAGSSGEEMLYARQPSQQ